jgi:hypothetical protein
MARRGQWALRTIRNLAQILEDFKIFPSDRVLKASNPIELFKHSAVQHI